MPRNIESLDGLYESRILVVESYAMTPDKFELVAIR